MKQTPTPTRRLRTSLETVARGRYLMPTVVALGVIAMVVNEGAYRHSNKTLTAGIALTDARVQAAQTLQLVTAADLHAHAYILSGAPDEAVAYRETVKAMHQVKQKAFDLVAKVDPGRSISIDLIETLLNEEIKDADAWVSMVAQGQSGAARSDAVSARSRERREKLREEFAQVLNKAAEIQQGARFSLYNALAISRMAVHLLALAAVLGMFLFQRQLRQGDLELAKERLQLSDRVKERTAELTEMTHHLVHAREDERARLARELHDEMGGLYTAMKLEFARLRRVPNMPEKAPSHLAAIESRLNEVIALKRRIIENLRPSALEQLGLVPALENLCHDMSAALGKPVHDELAPVSVDKNAELTLYRITQEALTNIGKYAQSTTSVLVQLAQTGKEVRLSVKDNGHGFDPTAVVSGRHGLIGMRVRVESHGGHLQIDSAPGQGTTIVATLPASSAPQSQSF
jgi:signal transduction histidine kinase